MKSSICYKSALPHIFRQTFIPLQLPILHVLEKKEINLFDHKEANKPKIKKQRYSPVVLEPVSMTRCD